jgi:alpha-aminoadipate/glutamate carrier protein LysW
VLRHTLVAEPPSRCTSCAGRRFCFPLILLEKEKVMNTFCPECEAEITLPANVMQNELIACPDCGADLEVINLNPVELALAPEVEEDWGE